MNGASHISFKACYYPALKNARSLKRCQEQAEWHLAPLKTRIRTEFPQNDAEAVSLARKADVIFYWQKSAFWGAKASHRRKGIIVDEYAQQAVGDTLDAFVARHLKPHSSDHSDEFFKRVRERRPNINQALIIGSGPDMAALEDYNSNKNDTTLTLYLSTSVLNERACEICPPDIIIAVDGPSQFGPSETGRRYRDRAAELIRDYGSLMLVPEQHLPSVQAHWPKDIQNHIFAVPLTRVVEYGHSLKNQWHYEPTSNVLTSFGLPCAASFTTSIYFAGVSLSQGDDTTPSNAHHWSHIDEALYQKHVAPMLICHPAAGQEDGGYMDRHHLRLSRELSAYNALGVEFSKLGHSPLNIDPVKYDRATAQTPPLKVRFFETIAKIEHRPEIVILAVFILTGLLGSALEYSIGIKMLGFIISGGIAVFLVAGLLFLRLRQNRLTARLENKLSQQQTQQFANLSERLEALEAKK
ncbi:hypothetical protein [Hellea balneolensis]|uniref:hypothetical protein n=1 Tax=Hellea balneolensis TaxID=287478 RepID=UPI0012B7F278|nr:hypothetical protein [Hellea balneolensis]